MANNKTSASIPTTRREFLLTSATRGIGLLAFSQFAPSFLVNSTLAQTPKAEKDCSILVVVQLAGGNDGLNTLIPFENADYYRLRPTLGISKDKVLRLTDTQGLNPACLAMQGLFHDGKLGIVQNVGYPNPNRSHFRSTEIWETGSDSDRVSATGWIGRYLDNACSGIPDGNHDPVAIHANTLNGEPESFIGQNQHSTFGLGGYGASKKDNEETRHLLESIASNKSTTNPAEGFLKQTLMDSLVTETKVQKFINSYKPETNYPNTPFGTSLKNIASLIAAGLPTRVYFVTLNGFDTHYNQIATQGRLLTELSNGLGAFQKDLEAHKLDDQVVTMTFSEFGRRASENESRGTDHGTSSPLFIMGSKIKAGLHGTEPLLNIPKNQDLRFSTDFRSVYATVLEKWLKNPSEAVLGGKFPILPFV
jgi:uncharacterized protein (DUF1501 family)